MSRLPPRLGPAFQLASAELGPASAARLFVREFPVLGCVAARWLAGDRGAAPDPGPLLAALKGLTRVLVVGLEADWLDVLLPACRDLEVGLLRGEFAAADFRRALANYDGLAVAVELGDLQRWAGRRSGLLCFVYGSDGHVAHVPGTWMRVSGPDVRAQFAVLVGWNILGAAMELYPRWLAEAHLEDFSQLVDP